MNGRRILVLVGCCEAKLPGRHRAADLYQSPLFRRGRAYAEAAGYEWAILSAKHGLLLPDTMIDN